MNDSVNISSLFDNETIIIGASAYVGKKIYDDLASPSVKVLGDIGAKILKAMLAGIDGWSERRLKKFNQLQDDVAVNLSSAPKEDIGEKIPENVIFPAMLAYTYVSDTTELRDMFAKLISRAICLSTQDDVHPAFVEILKNLHPKEAIIFKYLHSRFALPLINIRWHEKENLNSYVTGKENLILMPEYNPIKFSVSNLKQTGEIPYWRSSSKIADPQHITNLSRLGLVKIVSMQSLSNCEDEYSTLLSSPLIQDDNLKSDKRNLQLTPIKGFAQITPFGMSFAKTCLSPIIPKGAVVLKIPPILP